MGGSGAYPRQIFFSAVVMAALRSTAKQVLTKHFFLRHYVTVRSAAKQVLTVLYFFRGPAVAALVSLLFYSTVPQTLDIYRVLALDLSSRWLSLLFAFFSLIGVGLISWYAGRSLTIKLSPALRKHRNLTRLLLRLFPRICGLIPLLAVASGLILSANGITSHTAESETLALRLRIGSVVCVISALSLGVSFMYRSRTRRATAAPDDTIWLFSPRLQGGLSTLSILSFVYFAFLPVQGPMWLGPMIIINIFLIVFVTWVSVLSYVGQKLGFPFLGTLVLCALLSSIFDLNDNHEIRHTSSVSRSPEFLGDAYLDWLHTRKDRDAYSEYPVYIVAAQGGGIYAAYNAAIVLSRLQDYCPTFAQHIFAISGVSGGSVGAAGFASLVKSSVSQSSATPCSFDVSIPGRMEQDVDAMLSNDLLSPLLSAALFPDLLQRFLPFPINAWDRARALEKALEYTWYSTATAQENRQQSFAGKLLLFIGPQMELSRHLYSIRQRSSGVYACQLRLSK